MSTLKHFVLIALFLLTVFVEANAQIPTQNPAPTPDSSPNSAESPKKPPENSETKNAESDDLIHPGDVIDIDVVGSSEFDWRGSLTAEGFISGVSGVEDAIPGLCRSEEQISADVAKSLSKFLRDPVVVVKIIDRSGRPVAVVEGAVRTPQRFGVLRKVRLNEIIVLAGGFNDKTGDAIEIMRPKGASCAIPNDENEIANVGREDSGRPRFISKISQDGTTFLHIRIGDLLKGKPEANPFILSGDIVTVRETDPIYVIGGVATPRRINSRSALTLSRAIASAGGLASNADRKHIYLYRRTDRRTEVIELDYAAIESGVSPDIELRGFDIVEVAQTGRKRRQNPPIVQLRDLNDKGVKGLPLRVIE
jgi:protein involved in polysaccharide export with SLBB domain